MMQEQPRMVVVGAGAIGGITAALLRQNGHDVTLVCKHAQIANISSGGGLHLTGIKGDLSVTVPAVADIQELQGEFDIAMIATKAYDMPACAKQLLPLIKEDSLVVSMQNGICTDILASIVGEARTVGCVIGWGATMHGQGELEMTSTGEFIIGRLKGDQRALEPLREALGCVVPTIISDHIFAELYSKLIVNSCITSLGAICGLRLGEMLKRKRARMIFLKVIDEGVNVAHAMNLEVPPFGGKLDYDKLMSGTSALDNVRRHLMIYIVGLKFRNLKSSSLQSLERGRLTEIDYFNGYIADKGDALGVPCPVNRRLTDMVKEIEQGTRLIQVGNLNDKALG